MQHFIRTRYTNALTVLLNNLKNQSGTALLFAIVLAFIGMVVSSSVLFTSRHTTRESKNRRENISSINIAEAGIQKFYAKLMYDETFQLQPDTSQLIYSDYPLGNGHFTVRCITGTNLDTLTLRSKGVDGQSCLELEVSVAVLPAIPTDVSHLVNAAATANDSATIVGNIIIDGRDHDSTATLTGDDGVYAMSLHGEVDFGSSAAGVYAHSDPTEYSKNSYTSTQIQEFIPADSLASTPEEFFGLPSEAFDAYKTTTLTVPFHGLVYVTESVDIHDLENSSGILIIHNSTSTAELHMNAGTFKGLLLCDVMKNFEADVIGAVVATGSEEHNFGTGGNILYSSQVLSNLDKFCRNLKIKIDEQAWRELSCN
jgi:hypothetical protein